MSRTRYRDLPNSIENINLRKYGKAPTWEQIEDFLKEVGMSTWQFERFYGIAHNHLTTVKSNSKTNKAYSSSKILAVKYWHIFYEKIKPAYGVGFINDYTHAIVNGEQITKEPERKKEIPKSEQPKNNIPISDKHNRLAKLL